MQIAENISCQDCRCHSLCSTHCYYCWDKDGINSRCNFDSSKLRKLGFKSPVCLDNGLIEYAIQYRALLLMKANQGVHDS